MALERDLQRLTQVLFLEAAEVQGVVFAAGADVVDDQIVVGDLVALLGMVPEPTDVLDQLAAVVDERVVDGEDALGAVAGGRVLLEEVKAALVELADFPVGVGEEAVEAGLVGGLGKLPVDGADVLALGDEQAGEVLAEVAPLRLVGQQIAELLKGLVNDGGEVNDAGHGRLPGQGSGYPGSVQRWIESSAPSYLCKMPDLKKNAWRQLPDAPI